MCPQSSSLSIICAGIRLTQQLSPVPWPLALAASCQQGPDARMRSGSRNDKGSLRLSATDMPCRACVHAPLRPSSHPSLRYTAREYLLLSLDHFTPFHDCSMCPYLLLARGNVRFHVHSVVYICASAVCDMCIFTACMCCHTRYKVL